jgi:drug/metabolite transporter (DMT)-like permease
LKKAVWLVLAAAVLWQGSALAQEREPLVMRIELEWSIAGTVVGALVGAALWLTDPGNPNSSLSRQSIEGAALGAFAGAGFGLYVIQRSIQVPQTAMGDVPPSLWGTGADPITVRERAEALLAFGPPNRPSISISALRLRF